MRLREGFVRYDLGEWAARLLFLPMDLAQGRSWTWKVSALVLLLPWMALVAIPVLVLLLVDGVRLAWEELSK